MVAESIAWVASHQCEALPCGRTFSSRWTDARGRRGGLALMEGKEAGRGR